MDKLIKLTHHANEQLWHRGASEEEIVESIRAGKWQVTELGRLDCRKDFTYNKDWNGKHYQTKQVRPIFVEEADKIVVITVYVYYF